MSGSHFLYVIPHQLINKDLKQKIMNTPQAMSTQQVANRLVSLCREGKVLEAGEELYADNIVSYESEPSPVKEARGKAAVKEKGRQFAASIEANHGGKISDPIVAGNYFSLVWSMDVTMTGRGPTQMEELCVYEVKDGKIVMEHFYY